MTIQAQKLFCQGLTLDGLWQHWHSSVSPIDTTYVAGDLVWTEYVGGRKKKVSPVEYMSMNKSAVIDSPVAVQDPELEEARSRPAAPPPCSSFLVKLDLTTRQFVMVGVLAMYLFYLGYRVLYTLNPEALGFSLLFLYAEMHACLALGLYFFQIWNPVARVPPPAPRNLTVDILIPTYDEDLALLRKTAISCLSMAYPAKVFFLDDGNRVELSHLAQELGCSYLARENQIHAKAGNLNHALSLTDGEFVVVFDADYVPHPTFLERTLGYFQDPKVAFVQTPHNYYNVDSFQFWINSKKRDKWNEQDAFYRFIMPGRDYWNAAFFAGTSAVIRREALEEIGGFATGTITEDVETSVRLYANGWKGAYHNEVLSNGLATTDLASYHLQKLRWAEGNINLLFSENPLTKKGLTIPQRICFFATVFGWFVGIPETIYFVTPAIMLLTGWYPIDPFDWQFLMVYLVYLVVLVGGFKYVSRGYGRIGFNNLYNMTNFFVLIKAVAKSFLRFKSKFLVTPKGPSEGVQLTTILPQVGLALLCFAGMWWGVLNLYYRITQDYLVYSIGIFWTGTNASLAVAVIWKTTRTWYDRQTFRFIGAIPIEMANATGSHLVVSKDLNESGVSLETFEVLHLGEPLALTLHLGPNVVRVKGAVVYESVAEGEATLPRPLLVYGIRFEQLTQIDKDIIQQFCFHLVLPRYLHHYAQRDSWGQTLANWYANRQRFQKRARRRLVTLPCQITGPFSFYTVVNDLSPTGVAFTSHYPFEVGQRLSIEIFTHHGGIKMEIDIRTCTSIPPGYANLIGAEFIEVLEDSALSLIPYMQPQKNGALA